MAEVVGKSMLNSEHYRRAFPRLTPSRAKVTSPACSSYNCIAWAAGENWRRWWPPEPSGSTQTAFWPENVEPSCSKQAFIDAYRKIGYSPCENGDLEEGIEKIALFSNEDIGVDEITHACLQLPTGKWTSKLGTLGKDIEHESPEDLAGGEYGSVVCFLSRRS